MGSTAVKKFIWGPWSAFGLVTALIAAGADQFHKWWMIEIYAIAKRGRVALTDFLDVVMVWNKGISYGLLRATGPGLLVGVQILVGLFMVVWLARVGNRLQALASGLIIGGAIGNISDRLRFGAVADFFHFHAGSYSWYVFNLADVWIVAGAVLFVYDSFTGRGKTGR